MKSGTPELMKFKRLQRRLGVTTAQLVGHLELLWIATAKNAPEGDIGRFSNEDIAIACYWEDDPDLFVHALTECGWLDVSDEWRLLVHDWAQHAPTWVGGNLKRHGRDFRRPGAQATEEPTKELTKEPAIATSSEQPTTLPSQAKPNLSSTTPPQSPPNAVASVVGRWAEVGVGDEFFQRVRDEANRFAANKRCTLDRDLVWQACWIAVEFDRDSVAEVCEKIRGGDVRNQLSYLNGAMRKLCERNGEDWGRIKKLVPPPPPPLATIPSDRQVVGMGV